MALTYPVPKTEVLVYCEHCEKAHPLAGLAIECTICGKMMDVKKVLFISTEPKYPDIVFFLSCTHYRAFHYKPWEDGEATTLLRQLTGFGELQ